MSTTSAVHQARARSPRGGRHPVNVGHLVMGIAFLGLVGVWALIQPTWSTTTTSAGCCRSRGCWPASAGLLATTLSSRGKYETRVTGWVPATDGVDIEIDEVDDADERARTDG